jgi:hypothetical protein
MNLYTNTRVEIIDYDVTPTNPTQKVTFPYWYFTKLPLLLTK